MSTYRELLQRTRCRDLGDRRARRRRRLPDALWIDVREADEWEQGHIPGATFVPRGNLESRIEGVAPDRSAPIVLYCAAGNRSVFAAKTLEELGYESVYSLVGGFTDWKRNGGEIDDARARSRRRRTRATRATC